MFNFILYKISAFIAQALPLSLSYRLAEFLSDVHLFFSPKDRRALMNNLKIILPKAYNIPSLAREVSRNFGRYLVDFLRFPLADERYIKENIKVENLNFIEESLKKGNGVIIVSGHLGSWELGAVALSFSLGCNVLGVVLKHRDSLVDNFFNNQRKNKGFYPIPLKDAPRKCLEYLKENKVIIILVDRDFTQNGLIVDFLDRKALLPRGAAVFSHKTGAPIIPGLMTRNNDRTFTLHFDKPIVPVYTQDKESDIEFLMKNYISVIEGYIRQFPAQWLMFKEFWVDKK